MGEEISRLMDGELDDDHVELVCGQLKQPEGMATWVCYHVIGDSLRGTGRCAPGFSSRFHARLATEPTVLAPAPRASRTASFAWAAAATVAAVAVVGWVALSTLETQPTAMARAQQAAGVRAAQVGPQTVPADYLLAHQEYSPTVQIQGVGPYLRAAAAQAPDGRR
ncbi:MAG: sigma-E factor negative regulatory protein [Betaproteobacteria bacterium]